MRPALAACAVGMLAGCAGGADHSGLVDGNTGGDAGGCGLTLLFEPAQPVAGDHVKVTAQAYTTGVVDYHWQVDGVDNTSYEAADRSAIGFDVPTPVSHTVTVDITPANGCSQAQQTINVRNPAGAIVQYRMRVVPPAALAPPQEALITVTGGQSADRPFFIDPGAALAGIVTAAGTPTAAYVRFIPVLGPAFDTVTTGAFATRLQLQMHRVLVIPQDNALAPRLFVWMPGVGPTTFPVDAGTAATGTVLDRGGGPLANAQVQLVQLGVPSTIATTAANGTFTIHHTFDATDPITATITPPPASGLPRLTATAGFDLAVPLQVSYAASPAPCDLAATPVQRGGTNQGGAVVTVVGSLAGTAGTVTTGSISANATGTVHATAIATGGGTLPSLIVPRAGLAAVVELGAADFAVAALDTTACTAQTIDAPARIAATGSVSVVQGATQPVIGGARVEAVPLGALALANLIPVQATTAGDGSFTLALASGAHYELRIFDPQGRGAPLDFPDLTATGVPAAPVLAPALAITGHVSVLDNPNPVANASVQILCASCTGVAASQPIAQTATDVTGAYRIAVADPGNL